MPPTIILAGTSLILLICAVLLVLDTGGDRRLLRERVMATRELKSRQPGPNESAVNLSPERTFLLKLALGLGYRSDLPSAYAASPRIVIPVAAIIGVIVYNFSSRMFPHVASMAVGVVVAGLAARFAFRRKYKKYIALLFQQIPDTMSLMLRAVRAGLPVAEAVRNVGRESMSPTREEFARVAGETALGAPLEEALRRLADRTGIQEYAFFSVIIGLHGQTGGNLSETLENMADLVRRRVAMAAKGKALSAEGRLSAGLVGFLPFGVAMLTSVFNPDYLNEFTVNPNGPTLIVAFVVLLATGLFVTHMMIQRSMED